MKFIWGLPEGKNQDILERAIQGREAFRRFKDKAFDLGLIEKWYAYRDAEYVKVAKEWCERHHIEWEE